MKKVLGKIGVFALGLVVLLVAGKITHVIIIIAGAIIFGDSERVARNIDAAGNIIGLIVGLYLFNKLYRHFFKAKKADKSFKLTKDKE